MKKIKTKQDAAKEKRRNSLIIGVILVGLMVLSTAGYAFFSNEKVENSSGNFEYNGFKFFRDRGFWALQIEDQVFYFSYLPNEIENVSATGSYNLQNYSTKPLYFVNNNQATQEILNNIGRYILRYQEACLNRTECDNKELPIKTCEDNLIVFQQGEETKVWQDKNCVYISGDFIKGADAFLYQLFGIR